MLVRSAVGFLRSYPKPHATAVENVRRAWCGDGMVRAPRVDYARAARKEDPLMADGGNSSSSVAIVAIVILVLVAGFFFLNTTGRVGGGGAKTVNVDLHAPQAPAAPGQAQQ